MGLWFGTLIALFLLIAPGAIVARITQLTWPVAVAVGPALTYGVVALAIIPFGALGIPWNGWTALIALAAVCLLMTGLQLLLGRYHDSEAKTQGTRGLTGWPALTVAAGVLLGALLIMWAAYRGLVHWQSIPSTWDAVWHANEVRFVLDTGQASSTHMGELRNVETHQPLYYPSVFHALTAVFCQLTAGGAHHRLHPEFGGGLGLAVSVQRGHADLVSVQAHDHPMDDRGGGGHVGRDVGVVHVGALRRVRRRRDAQPGGLRGRYYADLVLITSTCKHRDRIPAAVLALVGILSVHLTGGFVVILFLLAWWLFDARRHPARGRLADVLILAVVAVPTALILAPQFIGVAHQADIIAGHAFPSFKSVKQGVIDALLLHTRHLNDFPTQYGLLVLSAIGMAILL